MLYLSRTLSNGDSEFVLEVRVSKLSASGQVLFLMYLQEWFPDADVWGW